MVNAQQCLVDGACRVALRQGDVLLDELVHLRESALDGVRSGLILWYKQYLSPELLHLLDELIALLWREPVPVQNRPSSVSVSVY